MSQTAQSISETAAVPLTIASAALTTTSATSSAIGMSRDSNVNASANGVTSVSSQLAANNGTSDQLTNVALSSSVVVQNTDNSNSNSDSNQRYNSISDENRYCWVCFANDEDDEFAAWVQPCRCSGTTKWVHQTCLQRWVDEKQKGNSFKRVNCPQCQTEYIIMFPEMGTFVGILEGIDTIIKRLSPFLAAGVIVGSLYWTAVTYGAVTVLQVLGHKNGLEVLERADPLVLLIGLPAIPAGLILGRMISWEEMLLRFIQNRQNAARKFPLLNFILPMPDEPAPEQNVQGQNQTPVLSDPLSATRIFCGALLMPTVSAIVGRVFFESIQNNLHRTLVGGLSFIVVKGALKIYFKHKQHARKKQRKILDFNDDNVRRFTGQQSQRSRNLQLVLNESAF